VASGGADFVIPKVLPLTANGGGKSKGGKSGGKKTSLYLEKRINVWPERGGEPEMLLSNLSYRKRLRRPLSDGEESDQYSACSIYPLYIF